MAVNRRLSEQGQSISWRMKSARMLTGLTQETFSATNGIPLMSLKCWEMGRAIPRKEGLTNYLNAIRKHGIDVSVEWIFHGSGPGPIYVERTQSSLRAEESDYVEQQIKLFQSHVRRKGLNPIVIKIGDDEMAPHYARGDMVGGYYVSLDKLLAENAVENIHRSPWLLANSEGDFMLAFLVVVEVSGQIFYRKNSTDSIKKLNSSLVGEICWRHRNVG